jgi:hypothetical protein
MNFLWNKQVSSNYLYIKNLFYFIFSGFLVLWTGHAITEKNRVPEVKFLKHREQALRMAGCFRDSAGALLRKDRSKGYLSI